MLIASLLGSGCSTTQPAQDQPAASEQPGSSRDPRERFERLMPKLAPTSDIVFVGKAFCSVRCDLPLPVSAVVSSLEVKAGDPVKKGQVLGRFRPASEATRSAAAAGPGQDRLITSPLDGHLLWVHPDFRPRAQLGPAPVVFKVGVMDPMIIRANVYEAEARRLAPNDEVTIRPETVLDWQVRAQITQVAWTPVSDNPADPSYYEVECRVANPSLVLREGMRILVHAFKPPAGR